MLLFYLLGFVLWFGSLGGMRCGRFQLRVLYQYGPGTYVRTLTSDFMFIFLGGCIPCFSCDVAGIRIPLVVCFIIFPGVSVRSRVAEAWVAGACPVTTDLVVRVNGRTRITNVCIGISGFQALYVGVVLF